ncbi:hypothetical protein [Galbitalea soli]|uniref:Uncharacterized protein n=1 Tax=Galbitalea soli TaxID=1268042 RepID=A0A7C9TQ04_9MICO|nr:hypothetical protein [Galbitalea soli]NEM90382.1 hypothetical protein [Galbitalea soli]NYJ31092.1 hypothetical protein [Galbitalea soli]
MSAVWIAAAVVTAVWMLALLAQLGDVATLFIDSRTARDRDVPGRIGRERVNQIFWVVPLVVVLALAIGVGVDRASLLIFGFGTTGLGSLLVLGIAVMVVAAGGLALAAVAVTDRHSYSALRRELRELEGDRLTDLQVAAFRARLSEVDARYRDRVRPRRVLLTRAGVVRVVPVVIGLALIAIASVAAAADPSSRYAGYVALSVFAPVVSAMFGALGVRLALSSNKAWARVYARQRVDILTILGALDRSSRKGVAGLGDRVARALQILREQQPQ